MDVSHIIFLYQVSVGFSAPAGSRLHPMTTRRHAARAPLSAEELPEAVASCRLCDKRGRKNLSTNTCAHRDVRREREGRPIRVCDRSAYFLRRTDIAQSLAPFSCLLACASRVFPNDLSLYRATNGRRFISLVCGAL